MNILGKNKKLSYEGEGIRIGLKTLLFSYPGTKKIEVNTDFLGVYITTNQFDNKLYRFLNSISKKGYLITIETEASNKIPVKFRQLKNIIFARTVISYINIKRIYLNDYIKVRVKEKKDLSRLISVANTYCLNNKNWNKVLLMPEYEDDWSKVLINNFKNLHRGIRFMPPIQDVLKIP